MSSTESLAAPSEEEFFKILLATDIHLGYRETHDVIGRDSFITFAEILQHAQKEKVDFILLGGDLFHDSSPSKESLNTCLDLFRKSVMGDKPITFEVLSDHEFNFYDSNTNISIPVFSIHGNHDDPSGFGGLSSMDLIETSGLMTYFGRSSSLEEVIIDPILLKKGGTQLAIYGLSHIHDNRLSRLFRDTKVFMNVPEEKSGDWFNVMVLHQNRVDRGPKNFIPEEILPNNIDFVLWGHEHDCRVEPENIPGKDFVISQPGSSVATSLSEGEAIKKHIAVLNVWQGKYRLDPIPLQTVRPFVFKSIEIEKYDEELGDEGIYSNLDIKDRVKTLLTGIVNDLLKEAKEKLTDCPSQPKLPLLRLRVLYKNENYVINENRFGSQFHHLVANPGEILSMSRNVKRVGKMKKGALNKTDGDEYEDNDDEIQDENEIYRRGDMIPIQDYVERAFKESNIYSEQLDIMFPSVMADAIHQIGAKADEDEVEKIIQTSRRATIKFCVENGEMGEDKKCYEEFRNSKYDEVKIEIGRVMTSRKQTTIYNPLLNDNDVPMNANTKEKSSRAATSKATTGTTRGRGRGAARGRAAAEPSTRTTTPRSQQQTIQQSMGRSSGRNKGRAAIVYDDDNSN